MKVHYTHLEEWKRNNPGKDWQKALLKLHYLELPSGMRRLWKEGDWNCHRSDFQLAELDRYNQRDYYSTAERKNHIVELIDKLAVPPRDKILSDRGRIQTTCIRNQGISRSLKVVSMSRYIHYTEIDKYRYKDDTSEEQEVWADILLPLVYDEMPVRLQREWLRVEWDTLIPIEQLTYLEERLGKDELLPEITQKKKGRRSKGSDPWKSKVRRKIKHNFTFIRYNLETGRLYRIDGKGMPVNQDCECVVNGYRYIWQEGRRYLSHRAAYFLKHKQDQLQEERECEAAGRQKPIFPEIIVPHRIIHLNGDTLDNRWVNLKVLGTGKRVKVQLRFDGELISLGYVDTIEARSKRIEHYRGLRSIGVDHEAAVKAAKDIVK